MTDVDDLRTKVTRARDDAELKAWKALAGYKFWMFGYHAAQWVLLNFQLGNSWPNPFKRLVVAARVELKARAMFEASWPTSEHGDAWNWPLHVRDGTRDLYRQRAEAEMQRSTADA